MSCRWDLNYFVEVVSHRTTFVTAFYFFAELLRYRIYLYIYKEHELLIELTCGNIYHAFILFENELVNSLNTYILNG